MLHKFITANTQRIIELTRACVAARIDPVPTEAELKNGVPLFLAQLIDRLSLARSDSGAIEASAAQHGGELLAMGYTVSQVVHGYGDICQVVTRLAGEMDAQISADEFHLFNRCLDDAIACSVTEFERQRDESVAHEGTERLGALVHELKNRLTVVMFAFDILQQGTVGIGGSTSGLLGRNLRAMRDLIKNSLEGVPLDSGLRQKLRVSVAALVKEAEVEAILAVGASDCGLVVTSVAPDIEVDVDRQIIGAAIANLVQDAIKFSRPKGTITLRTTATADRVLIEVEDECGGLLPGSTERLFRPFERQSADQSGLDLGLSVSRKGVEAMGGMIGARDLPGKGCVFSINLPRLPAA